MSAKQSGARTNLNGFMIPLRDDVCIIPLTKGYYALVDADDYELLSRFKWYYTGGYARRDRVVDGKRIRIYMHREVMQAPDDVEVDHVHHNTLDNRKSQLRLANKSQNRGNQKLQKREKSSRYKGVSWNKEKKKWEATLVVSGKKIRAGRFENEIDAAKAYDKLLREHFGEYALCNLPE